MTLVLVGGASSILPRTVLLLWALGSVGCRDQLAPSPCAHPRLLPADNGEWAILAGCHKDILITTPSLNFIDVYVFSSCYMFSFIQWFLIPSLKKNVQTWKACVFLSTGIALKLAPTNFDITVHTIPLQYVLNYNLFLLLYLLPYNDALSPVFGLTLSLYHPIHL